MSILRQGGQNHSLFFRLGEGEGKVVREGAGIVSNCSRGVRGKARRSLNPNVCHFLDCCTFCLSVRGSCHAHLPGTGTEEGQHGAMDQWNGAYGQQVRRLYVRILFYFLLPCKMFVCSWKGRLANSGWKKFRWMLLLGYDNEGWSLSSCIFLSGRLRRLDYSA